VPVIERRNAAFDLVLNAVHSVATEAERHDRSTVGPAQVVSRGALHAWCVEFLGFIVQLGADCAHRVVEPLEETAARADKHRSFAIRLTKECLRRGGQPDTMGVSVLGAWPIERRNGLAGHLPLAINDLLAPHMPHFAGTLPGKQDQLERGAVP
jgi:hypothetical protein